VNNCSEVAACVRQLEGVSDIREQEEILNGIYGGTVYLRNGQRAAPCLNCGEWWWIGFGN